jgi:hypothetical protein
VALWLCLSMTFSENRFPLYGIMFRRRNEALAAPAA